MTATSIRVHPVLLGYLSFMLILIALGLLFPVAFRTFFSKPQFFLHAKFIHILSVNFVIANALIGTVWETKSLFSKNPPIIRHTYNTVIWLDTFFTAPMVVLSVLSGILLSTALGGVWTIGWLSVAFATYLICGLVWLLIDIPYQHQIQRYFLTLPRDTATLPDSLVRLLWFRMKLNLFTLIPLLFIFYLMVHKPEIKPISEWFSLRAAKAEAMRIPTR